MRRRLPVAHRLRVRTTALIESDAVLDANPELIRTLTAHPPVVDGTVRIVEINGFDAQAGGGPRAVHDRNR